MTFECKRRHAKRFNNSRAVSLPHCDDDKHKCSVAAKLGTSVDITCPLRGNSGTIEWLYSNDKLNFGAKYEITNVVSDK